MENPRDLEESLQVQNQPEIKTDIFTITTIGSISPQNNRVATQGLGELQQYLDYLAKRSVIKTDQKEIFKNALKSAGNITIDGKSIWTKPYDDEGQEWTAADTRKFEEALDQYISFNGLYTFKDVEPVQSYIYGLNQEASQAVSRFIGDSYEFLPASLKDLKKRFNPHDCSFLFGTNATFLREKDKFIYRVKAESNACLSGYACYALDPEKNILRAIDDPRENVGHGNIICCVVIEAVVDLSNYASTYKPSFVFNVTVQTRHLKYTGSLGESIHEIERMETAQIGRIDTSTSKQLHDFQKDTIRAGALIQKMIALDLKKQPQNGELALSLMIELFNLMIDVHLQLNRLAIGYANIPGINRQLFLHGRDLRFFSTKPAVLPISLEDVFTIVFFGLEAEVLKRLDQIINDDCIVSMQGAAVFLNGNPDTFRNACRDLKVRNGFDPKYLAAVNYITVQGIAAIKHNLTNMLRIKKIGKTNTEVEIPEVYSDMYHDYLYKLLKGTLDPNPWRLNVNPAIISEFLSHQRPHNSPFAILDSLEPSVIAFLSGNNRDDLINKNILNFLASGLNIGMLLEKCLALGSGNPDTRMLSLIFSLATEIKTSFYNRRVLLTKKDESLDWQRPVADEMLSAFSALTDFQVGPLLKVFHPKSRANRFFEGIEEAAKAIDSTNTELGKVEQLILLLDQVVKSINTALEEIMKHRRLELISFKQQRPDEERNKHRQPVMQILNEFIHTITIDEDEDLQSLTAFFKLDMPIEPPKLPNRDADPTEVSIEVVYADIPRTSRRVECFKDLEWSKRMVLLDLNPITQAAKALALDYFIHQVLRLDTAQNLTTKGISMGLVMTAGVVGAGIGYRKIIHPNKPMNTFARIWGAVNNGLILAEFSLGIGINIYLYVNPKVVDISDPKFFETLFPAPMAFLLGYSVWHSLSPALKEKCFPLTSKKHIFIENGIDLTFKMLYYASVFSITSLVLFNIPPGDLMKGVVYPIALSLPLTILDKTRIKDTSNVTMNYLIAINFFTILGFQMANALSPNTSNITSIEENNDNAETIKILDYIQIAYWSLLLIFGLATMARHFISFPRRYEGDPNILIRKRPVNPSLLPEYSDHTDEDESYRSVGSLKSGEYKKLQRVLQRERTEDLEESDLGELADAAQGGKVLTFSGKHKSASRSPAAQKARSQSRCSVM